MLSIVVMLNNYFHDLATAVLGVSGVLLFVFYSVAQARADEPGRMEFFVEAYGKLTTLLKVSLVWILLGGAVRMWGYMDYEWLPAAGRGQIAALAVKHILLFSVVGVGIHFWLRVKKEVAALQNPAKGAGS